LQDELPKEVRDHPERRGVVESICSGIDNSQHVR
jgi:hypothetical protein